MTKLQKLIKLQAQADKHLWKNAGFNKSELGTLDYWEWMSEKSSLIYRRTRNTKGGWGARLGGR